METTIRHTVVTTVIGDLTLVAVGETLAGAYFPGHWTRPDRRGFGTRIELSGDPFLAGAAEQFDEFLRGERQTFDLPLSAHGDAFQERIWALLKEIPYGQTTTYGEIAAAYGDRSLAREVGQAVGSNPVSIVVPCHRVVAKGGKLGGYAGGVERKRKLLELEGALPPEDEIHAPMLDGFGALTVSR